LTYGDSGRSGISLFREFLRGINHSPFLKKLQDFDLYIDDSGYAYSALAGFRSKIPYRIGRNFQGFGFLNHYEVPLDFNVQLIERRLKLLRPFGIKLTLNDIPKPYMNINQDIISRVRDKFGISKREYFVVQPFAGWEAKNWGLGKYCQVTKDFASLTGLLPVFIGSTAEQLPIQESIAKYEMNAINLAGLAQLDESAAIIAGAKFYFGPDSVGNHLAVALGVKSLTIFGPTHPTLSTYLGGTNIGIRKITRCTPGPNQSYCCIDGGRSCRHLSCIRELRQEDVFETLRRHWSGEKLPPVVEF
jgi:ADP-heptose:LPS heptosyltransferase